MTIQIDQRWGASVAHRAHAGHAHVSRTCGRMRSIDTPNHIGGRNDAGPGPRCVPISRHGVRAVRRWQRQTGRALLLDRIRHAPVAYRGPENGFRDHAEYVMAAGSARFVLTAEVHAGTTVALEWPSMVTVSSTLHLRCRMSPPPTHAPSHMVREAWSSRTRCPTTTERGLARRDRDIWRHQTHSG